MRYTTQPSVVDVAKTDPSALRCTPVTGEGGASLSECAGRCSAMVAHGAPEPSGGGCEATRTGSDEDDSEVGERRADDSEPHSLVLDTLCAFDSLS